MLLAIIISCGLFISLEIQSRYEIDVFRSILYGLIVSLIFVSIMTTILIFSINKSVNDYVDKDMNEIEINGETKIENVSTSDEYRFIATYQHDDKSYFVNFATNDKVNIKKGDKIVFNHYKEQILKDSSAVTVTNSDIKDGKVKIKHN